VVRWSRCPATRVGRQHLVKKLVRHAALDKLLLRQHAVVVFVHLVEYFLRPAVRGVVRVDIRQRWTDHVEYCLYKNPTRTSYTEVKAVVFKRTIVIEIRCLHDEANMKQT